MSGYPVWNPSAFYTTGEVVAYNGTLWQALQLTINNIPPSSPNYWTAVGGGGGGNVNAVSAGVGISITGSGSNPVVNQTLVGTAGTYAYPASITTDNTGRITAATAGSAPVLSVSAGYGLSISGTAQNPTLNNAGIVVVNAGSRIGVVLSPPETATVSYTPLSAFAHQDVVAISSATGTTLGATFTPTVSGLYTITYTVAFQSGSGATPIEVNQSLGNYIAADFNAVPSLVYVAPATLAPPPKFAAPAALFVWYNTPTTQTIQLTAGQALQLRVRVNNTGSGMSFDPNTAVYVDIVGAI